MDDALLLKRYVDGQDQEAFADLVGRHGGWLNSAARRQLRDGHLAEDVTQAVFVLLSRRAKGITHGRLSGWLFLALGYCIRETRRRRMLQVLREKEAASMRKEAVEEARWEEIAPELDAAVGKLGKADREAVLLRFYEQRPLVEVGRALGISEEAARKRVDRAVEKLRGMLGKKGVTGTTAGLSAVLAGHVVGQMPEGIVEKIVSAVGSGSGSTVATAIAKGAMKMMVKAKVKVAAVVWGIVLAGAGVIWVGIEGVSHGQDSTRGQVQQQVRQTPQADVSSNKGEALRRLTAVYKLGDGQIIRRVDAPFPPERDAWADFEYPYAKGSQNIRVLGFLDSGQMLRPRHMGYETPTLKTVTELDLQAPWFQITGLERTGWEPVDSDWIVRENATLEQRLTALAEMITSETGERTHFEKKVIKRPCIVLRRDVKINAHAAVFLDPQRADQAKTWTPEKLPPGVKIRFGIDQLSEYLDAPFYNEAETQYCLTTWCLVADDVLLHHTDANYLDNLKQVLDRTKAQVGGEWSIQDRDVETWDLIVE